MAEDLQSGAAVRTAGDKDKKRRNRKWTWFAVGAASVALSVLMILGVPQKTDEERYYMVPVIYGGQGGYDLALGPKGAALAGAEIYEDGSGSYINGMIDEKRNYLYYVAGAQDGSRTLMQFSLSYPYSTPLKFAYGVDGAACSKDGGHVLYTKNTKDGKGELYLFPGFDLLMAESVTGYGFSDNGEYIYYISAGEGGRETLYIKKLGFSDEQVYAAQAGQGIYDITVFNDGAVCFTRKDGDNLAVFRWEKGGIASIGGGWINVPLSSSELLYNDGTELSLWTKGGGSALLSSDLFCTRFATASGRADDPRMGVRDRFLLFEGSGPPYMLSEYVMGKGKAEIAKADSENVETDSALGWVCYQSGGLYSLAHKTDAGWEAVKTQKGIYDGSFGVSGEYFYYLTPDMELRRYDMKTAEETALFEKTKYYWEAGGIVYASDEGGALYRIGGEGNEKLLQKGVSSLQMTFAGGLFAVTGEEGGYTVIYFAPGSSQGETVAENVKELKWVTGEIVPKS